MTVSVQPASANIFLGAALQFQATVAGASNKSVIWEVNSAVGGNAQTGTISSAGLYTAPAILPFPASVTVTAISAADATTSGSATLTITDNIVVSISPLEVTVPTGTAQVFSATLTTSGNPAPGIAWSVNGVAGGNAIIGTIVAGAAGTALYTAPSLPPAPPTVSVTATSIADSSKSASAGVTIACSAANSISPASASVSLGNSQVFSASFCAAAGATITWDVNGAVGGNATVGTIAPSSASAALYIAPADLPPANLVTVHATINAGAGAATTSSTVTVTSHVSVSVSPPAATLALAQRSSFAASVTGTPDAAVTWSVNGILNGNSIVGTVCVAASNPCMPPSSATATSVDYVAPTSMPVVNTVTLLATSLADPSQSAASIITIAGPTGPVSVTISPQYAFLPPSSGTLSTQQFFVTVSGTTNTSVTWSVESAVAGQGCAGAACGSVSATGLYSAPTVAPSPNGISVIATSRADATKSASSTIALTSGPVIEKILPSSAIAGAIATIPFKIQGANFVAGSGASRLGNFAQRSAANHDLPYRDRLHHAAEPARPTIGSHAHGPDSKSATRQRAFESGPVCHSAL